MFLPVTLFHIGTTYTVNFLVYSSLLYNDITFYF